MEGVVELDKKTLKQHKSLRQELESIDKKLDKLYERQKKYLKLWER